MKFTVAELIFATNAKVLKNNTQNSAFSISTDTRTITPDDIYIGLKGQNFDGEDFIQKAVDSGAKAYFTTKDFVLDNSQLVLKVENPLIAYLQLAKLYLNKVSPKVVALTGSSGKTTTKEMLTSVCRQQYKTFSTPLNHNNEVGFCQTILSMPKDTRVLILEMGMRGLGEIKLLSKYSNPDISIITNVGTSHIGRLGSRENIAKAKCEICSYQKFNGCFIANDSELIKKTVEYDGEKVYFSIKDVDFLEKQIGKTKFTYKNETYQLNIEGDYNVENALAVIEAGLQLDIAPEKINDGLKQYCPIEKRWQIEEIGKYKIINDAYNANPDSMKASLLTIFELYPDTVLVLGDMGELGDDSVFYHRNIGEFILDNLHDNNYVKIITVGNLAKEIANKVNEKLNIAISFENNKQAADYIKNNIKEGSTIFLKASRSMKFEEIVNEIKGALL
ncbi:UDP-N-acetylmuramoyl-tripeptide--D-alanyl-D-alanine ligase [bacterium]|nr:UDP-N-acetylmuramoyl-tripeptide--D-alanyl-D-alanine ligase [bacterium]